MSIYKEIKAPLIIALSSILLYFIDGATLFFGAIVNIFFPCEQSIENSFPCFGIYDMYLLGIVSIIFILSVFCIAFRLYKMKKQFPKKFNINTIKEFCREVKDQYFKKYFVLLLILLLIIILFSFFA
ncbi:hypothetical protein KKG22_02405 [Patescibacteria group bacterium]|nr:hypothetical protein [Patescibacteria group bacterium]MBU1721796.1 hypothetical protein [Patescibacteria group bacterium]